MLWALPTVNVTSIVGLDYISSRIVRIANCANYYYKDWIIVEMQMFFKNQLNTLFLLERSQRSFFDCVHY
jgi:hypothetical protein